MIANSKEYLYWKTNPDWYDYDKEDNVYLTDKAPQKAIKSFENYKRIREKEKNANMRLI